MLKRLLDVVVSGAALVLLFPVLAGIAIAIRLDSTGPIFYRGRRAGRHGTPFRIFKFRTMVVDADRIGGPSTSDTDPRITKTGKFLRRYKLDELPQLLNVFLGQMSLVGPRPQVESYVSRYSDEEREILKLRPGITDWASIWNSDEGAVLAQHADPDRAYDELIHPTKMKLQLVYARDHGVVIDIKIIAHTLIRMVRRDWMPRELAAYPRLYQMPPPTPCARHASEGASRIHQLVAEIGNSSRGNGAPLTGQATNYETVTEMPGAGATREQIAMLHTRYSLAGDLAAGKEVLELACGPGIGLGHLASRAARVVGGDVDPKLVQIARSRHGNRVEVQQIDATALPFAAASFDVVLLLEAIYYLPNADRFVAEARRVLRPGGALLICSANCERSDFNPSPFATSYFSANQLRDLISRHGFHPEILAGFPIQFQGVGGVLRQILRNFAVRFRLIPRTMKWKARLKRIVFGRLQGLPETLGDRLSHAAPLAVIGEGQDVRRYQVLYVIGRLGSIRQQAAA
jgi:lipopolysaccharide/colanic/teichoic acid biosynthesis glycosyltransferase/SAM-dependent methyltransferase